MPAAGADAAAAMPDSAPGATPLYSPGDQAPPAKRRRVVCIGECKLGLATSDGQPLALRAAWKNEQHEHHKVAVAVIAQLFTYMQLWHLQYR